ncbi:MAG: membrane integrity-associated transporter subunit PqiC [Geminicoccaceae bacterium]|nr:membrane integrity-associated transporter subunit PqiC [Geminicoccaceae bacterium]
MTVLPRRPFLALLGTAPLAAGCAATGLIARTPPRIFRLDAARALDEGLPKVDAVLLIETPTAVAGLNSARVALKPEPSTLDFYADALWVDVVPVMVQQLVGETLAFSDKVGIVGPADATGGQRPTHALNTYVLDFQAVYDEGTSSPPLVDLHLGLRLLAFPRREQVALTELRERERAGGTSLDEVIAAFDRAADHLLAELASWVLRSLAA